MRKCKICAIVLSLIILAVSTACANTSAMQSETDATVPTQNQQQGSTSAVTNTNVSYENLDVANMFSTRDKEIGYEISDAVKISLSDNSSSCESKSVNIVNDTVTILQEGTYVLSGTLSNGQIVVECDDQAKVQIVLDGVNVNCDTSAAIYVKKADKVFITLASSSENQLSNKNEFVAIDDSNIDSVIFSKEDLTLNGNGTLTVTANYGHGIVSKDDLVLTCGTYVVNAQNHALSANNSIRIADGIYTLTSGKDALHSEDNDDATQGFVYIADGDFTIKSDEDGISAQTILQIDNGNFNIVTGGGSANAPTNSGSDPGFEHGNWMSGTMPEMPGNSSISGSENNSGGEFPQFGEIPQGGMKLEPPEGESGGVEFENSTADSTDTTTSTKGMKSGGDMLINNGTIEIDSVDDGLHSNANVNIANAKINISSGDDGIHTDGEFTISGGIVNITKSYEGIEGKVITITGGYVSVVASDDGFNATSGTSGGFGGVFAADDSCSINISGGEIFVDAGGDGLDSNGNILVSGGTVYVSGPTNSGNGALDYASSAAITGGTVVAVGASGMAESFGSESTQGSILYNLTEFQAAGTQISLKDSQGNVIASFTPQKQFNSVVVSCPEILADGTYTLIVGSQSNTITMSGLTYGSNSGMSMGGNRGEMGGNFAGRGNKPTVN